ncbi:hypothetical protein [Mesorhizobium sp. M0843]|uniref:sunset domain-containing protein n=1 Tax=Mesorhizobium sp. M0843 TaxID=2957010 RepID=UPI0033356907
MTFARDYALLDSFSVFSKKYDFVVGHGLGFPKRGLIADGHFSQIQDKKNRLLRRHSGGGEVPPLEPISRRPTGPDARRSFLDSLLPSVIARILWTFASNNRILPLGKGMGKAIHNKWKRRRRPLWRSLLAARLMVVLTLLGITSVAYVATNDVPALPRVHYPGTSSSTTTVHKAGCAIKGNINERGEHIYHMPGQAYYSATRVNPARGERWFCSQWEAWWAGWRKAKV